MTNGTDRTGAAGWTSSPPGRRWSAGSISSWGAERRKAFLDGLSANAIGALPHLWDFWALDHQLPPEGEWRSWVCLGGRGAGKTRAGAEWVRSQVEGARPLDGGRARRVALVGETFDQARDVMVFGESGLMACSPPDRRPRWVAGSRKLVWPNGAEAQCFSAHEPEALRGPQFDAAWCDELAKWKRGQDVWDMLQFCLRLGDDPRAVVTTTPRDAAVLKGLLARPSTVVTHAATRANAANLARGFLEEVEARFAGTRLGRQELEGVVLDDVEGALWTTAMLEACRVDAAPDLERIVVGVDPSATAGGDATGIVVVGVAGDRAWVLEDASVEAASPVEWAEAVAAAYGRWGADRVIAEGNQGGDMVEAVLRQVAPDLSYRKVSARVAKSARAEPVAALYERGRVRHLRGPGSNLGRLEDEMCRMTVRGFDGRGSPDRVDALVWALWEAVLDPGRGSGPRARML